MAFDRLRKRWRTYTGDRNLELAIRSRLRSRGFRGHGATILDTRLIAVARPGWLQVYSFSVETEDEGRRPRQLFGLARVDERAKSEIELFEGESDRDLKAVDWSRGLVVAHRRQRSTLEWALIGAFVLALVAAGVAASLSSS